MDSFFAPAIALMNRLKYPQKFALISLLFAIPLALLIILYLFEANARIAFAQKEIDGNVYLRPMRQLLEHTLQEELLAHDFVNGDQSVRAPLLEAQARIDADLQALADVDQRLGKRMGTTEQLAALTSHWQDLKARTATMRARTSEDMHAKLIAHIRDLISLVGDNSNLILDPDLDTYYIMDTVLLKLPEAQNLLARIRLVGDRVIAQQSVSPEDRAALITLGSLIQSNVAATQKGLMVAFHNTASQNLQPALQTGLDRYTATTNTCLHLHNEGLIQPRVPTVQSAAYRMPATEALATSFSLWDAAVDKLDELLQARIDSFNQRKYLAIGVTVGILVLVLFVWVAFYLAVMRTVQRLARASERMMSGDFSAPVQLDIHDELGEVVRSFNGVATALLAASAQRQAVLDNAVDGIITIEEDGRIASFNPAAERIFGLDVSEAIGRSVGQIIPAPHNDQYRMVGIGREVTGQRADGTSFPLDLAVGEMRMGDQHRFIAIVHDLTERKRAAEERARLQEQIIRAQAATLAELSTPLIPISDAVVVMPLIGALDDQRMQQVLEALLHGVEQRRARMAILDITGVPVVDAHVANGLILAAQAVRLLGARVILTGIRPEVAQTLVGLGVDLSDIITHSTLQSGIAYATNGQGRARITSH
jgi:PAS domain S-box-containing protein